MWWNQVSFLITFRTVLQPLDFPSAITCPAFKALPSETSERCRRPPWLNTLLPHGVFPPIPSTYMRYGLSSKGTLPSLFPRGRVDRQANSSERATANWTQLSRMVSMELGCTLYILHLPQTPVLHREDLSTQRKSHSSSSFPSPPLPVQTTPSLSVTSYPTTPPHPVARRSVAPSWFVACGQLPPRSLSPPPGIETGAFACALSKLVLDSGAGSSLWPA